MSSATEEHSLGPFPGLNTHEEKDSLNRHNTPFPGNRLVFEDHIIKHGDIKNREYGNPSDHDRPKKELVAPDIIHPLGKVFF